MLASGDAQTWRIKRKPTEDRQYITTALDSGSGDRTVPVSPPETTAM
jgi:hypothetical protein